jgi:shikimate dehydrogenase
MRVFGLIGQSLAHSFSPTYFAQKFATLGLSAKCSYEAFELPTIADFPALLAAQPHLDGLNVTIPYKQAIIPYLDALAPSAQRVGAVNTVAFVKGRLIGHNTDLEGFGTSLDIFLADNAQVTPTPLRALILGHGGAARAVEAALKTREIAYWYVSRNPLAAGLAYDELTPIIMAQNRLIINTTPVGTWPNIADCPAIPYESLTPDHRLFDLVYNPAETEFLRRGRVVGAKGCNGRQMLELQADAAWRVWTAGV